MPSHCESSHEQLCYGLHLFCRLTVSGVISGGFIFWSLPNLPLLCMREKNGRKREKIKVNFVVVVNLHFVLCMIIHDLVCSFSS